MSQAQSVSGRCLCGRVTVKAQNAANHLHACHCATCRRWSGGPFMAVECERDVSFEGRDYVKVFESSDWAQRGFCSECGTHLFYRLKPTGQYSIPAALFDELKDILFEEQLFIEEKPDYYEFKNQTTMMTGKELFALFATSQQDND